MKKIISISLILVMLLSLSACGSTGGSASSGNGVTHNTADTNQGSESEIAVTTEAAAPSNNDAPVPEEDSSAPIVYFTSDISAEGLIRLYDQLGWEPTGNLAVKVSTGEPPASNYLRQDLIGELVQSLNGTYVECMTAYGGQRSSIAMAKQVAEDHGFAPFDLLDEDGSMVMDVEKFSVIPQNYVGAGMADYDSMLVLSHFKGHAMAGFGGAIKNISIGLGSVEGKNVIHTGGKSHTNWYGGDQSISKVS